MTSVPRLFAVLGPALALISGNAAAQSIELPDRIHDIAVQKYQPDQVDDSFLGTPNPYLSLSENVGADDWGYWRAKMAARSAYRAEHMPQARVRMVGYGDREFTLITRFGTLPFQDDSVEIEGSFDLPPPIPFIENPEDNGDIPSASETGLTTGNSILFTSFSGDGPYGSAGTPQGERISGDFDVFVIRDVKAGQLITVKVDTPEPFEDLDPYVEILAGDGTFLAANDDGSPFSFDSFLAFEAPANDDYYITIAGFGAFFLLDPFDSSSGIGGLTPFPVSEGEYTARIGLDYADEQVFKFFSRRGDVVGAVIEDAFANLSLRDRTRTERQGSTQDISGAYPTESPLPGGGLAALSHVVDRWGLFTLKVNGYEPGHYSLNIAAALPTLREGAKGDVQTIFIDFDGETVDLADSLAEGAPPGIFVTTLSPLSAFLSDWGLMAADEEQVIDATMKVIRKSLVRDIRRMGGNRDFKIRLLNSYDHPDPFGMPNVSRVIVGGTIDELFGIQTIGIAQSIDVGNFATDETAFVLLDILSGQIPSSIDLNSIPRDPGSTIIDVIGRGVGEITAHEAGHYLGNWHTDQFNLQPNIMDQGGNLEFSILGLGPDGTFGTADDVDVMFVRDEFVPSEGFTGIEDSLTTIAWGATTPKRRWWWGHDDDDGDDDDDD